MEPSREKLSAAVVLLLTLLVMVAGTYVCAVCVLDQLNWYHCCTNSPIIGERSRLAGCCLTFAASRLLVQRCVRFRHATAWRGAPGYRGSVRAFGLLRDRVQGGGQGLHRRQVPHLPHPAWRNSLLLRQALWLDALTIGRRSESGGAGRGLSIMDDIYIYLSFCCNNNPLYVLVLDYYYRCF